MTTPSTVSYPLTLGNIVPSLPGKFNLENELLQFENNPAKFIKSLPVKSGKSGLKLLLNGELTTEGILVNTDFDSHSIGFKFDDDEDMVTTPLITRKQWANCTMFFQNSTLKTGAHPNL